MNEFVFQPGDLLDLFETSNQQLDDLLARFEPTASGSRFYARLLLLAEKELRSTIECAVESENVDLIVGLNEMREKLYAAAQQEREPISIRKASFAWIGQAIDASELMARSLN